MNICLDVRFKMRSGASTLMLNLVENLLRRPNEHRYWLLAYPDQNEIFTEYRCEGLLSAPRTNTLAELAWTIFVLPRLLQRLEMSLYVSFKFPIGPILGRIPRVLVVNHVYGAMDNSVYPSSLKGSLQWRIWRIGFRHATRLIAVSDFVRRFLVEKEGFPSERIDTVHNGIDPFFRRVAWQEVVPVLEQYGIQLPYLLCCGNMIPVKNHETAVRVLAQLSGERPDLQLVIAGRNDTEHAELIRSEIHRLGLKERVHLIGFINHIELRGLISGAELLLHPSLSEAAPMTILEALACGLPVVVADLGGMRELGGNAVRYIIDPRNYLAVADAVRALLEESDQRAAYQVQAMQQAGHFSLDASADGYRRTFSLAVRPS